MRPLPYLHQQVRSPASPGVVLPTVLQSLCLACIADVVVEDRTLNKDNSKKPWLCMPVDGLSAQSWAKSTADTFAASYHLYYPLTITVIRCTVQTVCSGFAMGGEAAEAGVGREVHHAESDYRGSRSWDGAGGVGVGVSGADGSEGTLGE